MELLKLALDFFYPPICGICGSLDKNWICKSCAKQIASLFQGRVNKTCNLKPQYFSTHMYAFSYEGIIRDKILDYKFHGKSYLYHTFTKILLNDKKIYGFLKSCDIIMPVPLDIKKKRKRGFNQSELCAKALARQINNLNFENQILQKIVVNKSQSTLNKQERIQNVKNVYTIRQDIKPIENKTILLFDDVYTTGNTVNECSKILKKAGAKKVKILTIAKD